MLVLDKDAVALALVGMCDAAQIPYKEIPEETLKDLRDQVIAFVLALNKNFEREQTYHGLWKRDTMGEIGELISHKGKRMTAHSSHVHSADTPEISVQEVDAATDDAIDIINYGAFCARLVHYAYTARGAEVETQS